MATINLEKQFTMPLDEVRKGIEKIANSLENDQGMKWSWQNEDAIEFSHKAGKGTLAIAGDKLVMQLKIGMLYAAVAPVVKKKVQDYADKHIY